MQFFGFDPKAFGLETSSQAGPNSHTEEMLNFACLFLAGSNAF
jgi:hypothetical protein